MEDFDLILQKRKARFKSLKSKLTVREMAEKIGISHVSIYNYISGTSTLAIDNIIALSQVLNVSVDYLLGLGDYDIEATMDLANDNKRATDKLHLDDDSYTRVSFRSIKGLKCAKKIQFLCDSDIDRVDAYIDFILYQKTLIK